MKDQPKKSETEEDEAFLHRLIFPEEDRHRFTATPWRGGYRWFRSENVVCIEHYRVAHEPMPRSKAS